MVATRRRLSDKSQQAIDFYMSEIKPHLSDEDDGRYIVIDAATKEWVIGDTQDVHFTLWDRTHSPNLVMLQHPNIFMKLWSSQLRSIR